MRVDLEHRDRRPFGKKSKLAAECLHLAMRLEQAVELLGELHLGVGVVGRELLVGAAQPIGARERLAELIGSSDVRDVQERHRGTKQMKKIRAIREQHPVEGDHHACRVDGVDPPYGGEHRQPARGHQRHDKGDEYLLIIAAREEHCRSEPPRRPERRGAERRTPDPGLRMLARAAAAPISERERPECRRDDQDRALPEHDQLGRARFPQEGAQEQAQHGGRANRRLDPAINVLAALLRHFGRARIPKRLGQVFPDVPRHAVILHR